MTFAALLSEATAGTLPRTGDVLAVGLPLLRDINSLHHEGLVTGAEGVSSVDYDGERLWVRSSQTTSEQSSPQAIDAVARRLRDSGIAVTRRSHDMTADGPFGTTTSRDVADPADGRPTRPVFVPGYRMWEQLHGHHDEITDIGLAGLWLCSYAFGLDLDTPEGINHLALHYRHTRRLNPDLHPVVSGALAEMVTPDRAARSHDIAHVIARLEHHRDLPADLDLSAAYLPDNDWRRSVLTTLRDRVFDTTRRNRELYYRHTASSVSLTEASVPLLLNSERIKPQDLLTWTEPSNKALRKGKEVDLATWCRFEETPYVAPALDKLISAERKTRVETGHGRLRLVIAFLHWFDPESGQATTSPLLTLPAELTRKRGVQTRYRVKTPDDPASVNAILRHVFASRFDIELPETLETDPDSIEAFVSDLQQRVRATAPEVVVEIVDKPQVELLRRKAQLRLDTYRRRRAKNLASSGRWRRQDHSYELDDWRPLGLALYQRFVRPSELPMRDLAGAPPRPRLQALAATADPTVRESESYSVGGPDASATRWQVDLCSVTLAMLGSRRTSLARDYDEVLGDGSIDVTDTPFEQLFQPEPARNPGTETEPMSPRHGLVLPADDAQARAVQRAVRGDSFIVQGPPGTGKSQTITNIIAALVAEGRRVLFVCEKRAAIDVVSHRLDQVGLGELAATIHDSQLDRKSFVKSLGHTYDAWVEDRPLVAEGPTDEVNAFPAREAREALVKQIEAQLRPVEALSAELNRPFGGGEIAVAAAIERLSRLVHATTDDHMLPEEALPALDAWAATQPGLERVETALSGAGLQPLLGNSPALRVRPAVVNGGDPVAVCRALGRDIASLPSDIDDASALADYDTLESWLPTASAVAQAGATNVLHPSSPRHLDLRSAAKRQIELGGEANQAKEVLSKWTSPLSAEDTASGLELARAKEGSFFKFLNGRWRALKTLVEASYAFDQHQVKPTITSVLEDLHAHHQADAASANHRAANMEEFGVPDAVELRNLVDNSQGNRAFADFAATSAPAELELTYRSVGAHIERLLLGADATMGDLRSLGVELEGTPVAAEAALLAWSSLVDTDVALLATVLDSGASTEQIERKVLRHALEQWEHVVDAQAFSGPRVDETVSRLAELHTELLSANAAETVERAQQSFYENLNHSDASMAGRSQDDKDRKRKYNAGRRIVEREAAKKIRHRSIREMTSGDSGVVVRDLRPIWMMSPLSVSDTLPLEADLFDVVIFDEASQIPVEDAIPSVFRAPQVIVVGDQMQMPPTRFFSSDDAEDSEVIADEHGHRLSISLDADSFLTQADLALDSSMLNWHYRSRFESLIAYSNHAFYDGRLATIPDRALPQPSLPEIAVESADDAADNVHHTRDRPISFHFLRDGQYRDRRNVPEADYIAELIRAELRADTNRTIGVVAFSEAQQSAIESSLDELTSIDPGFAELYETELGRTEDGEYVGLFVKNLENVQGDERDLIIMSVCYGPDANGKVRMNFGPINNAGGERRLNVIFSRARQNMAVVASLHGHQITNVHNEGASHLAGFLTYAAAESIGGPNASRAVLRSHASKATEIEPSSAVAGEIATALAERGWRADVAVGRSDFRVDVAVVADDEYVVGVLIEPGEADEQESPTARYIAEAGVLHAFGWPIVRVPLSDWLADATRVIERIEVAVQASSRSSNHC